MHKLNIEVVNLSSTIDGTFSKKLSSILNQLDGLPKNKILLKLTFFTSCTNNSDFELELIEIQEQLRKQAIKAPVSLIGQIPLEKNGLSLELFAINNSGKDIKIEHGKDSLLLKLEEQEVLFASVNSFNRNSFQENTENAFQNLNSILKEYKYEYSDVLRQWNYIEDILYVSSDNEIIKQNYQLFNNYRSLNYQTSVFNNGYPVATGIGTTCGGCCIEIIAVKGKGFEILPVHNTRQVDAHCYSGQVLVGNQQIEKKIISTPKFERAKYINCSMLKMLLVSGTASIIGEKTVCLGDVAGQTLTTIENIKILLESAIIKTGVSSYQLLNYRVYIKNIENSDIVKEICTKYYGKDTGVFLISDICRDDLLVEIECNYIFS